MARTPATAAQQLDPVLVDAATTVVARDGVAGLSLVAVAAEAGLSRVTLHRRGVTRTALAEAVVQRPAADLRASLWPALTAPGSAAERLEAALGLLCDVVERHRAVLAAFFVSPDPPRPERAGQRGGQRAGFDFIEPFERLLRDGLVDGSLHSDDPASDAELIVNAVTWTYLHLRSAHGWAKARARRCIPSTLIAAVADPTVGS